MFLKFDFFFLSFFFLMTCAAGGTSPVQAAVVATTASVATSSMSSAAAHTSQMINGIKVAYHQSGFTAAGSRVTTSLVKSLQPAPSRPTPPPHHYHHHPSHNNMTQGGFNSSRGYNNDGVDDNNMMRPVKKVKNKIKDETRSKPVLHSYLLFLSSSSS